jgi:catechol 2,3-dioxygenase-like lactoylglutathione lyase family enzyme
MRHKDIVELDHVSLSVRSLRGARRFYEAALGAIGMKKVGESHSSTAWHCGGTAAAQLQHNRATGTNPATGTNGGCATSVPRVS